MICGLVVKGVSKPLIASQYWAQFCFARNIITNFGFHSESIRQLAMLRPIILLAIFLGLLVTAAQFEHFKSLMALAGIFAVCAMLDWASKPK